MTTDKTAEALAALDKLIDRHGTLSYVELGMWVCDYIDTVRAALQQKPCGPDHIDRMKMALLRAATTFKYYGELHEAKPDIEKAKRNYELSAIMFEALAYEPAIQPPARPCGPSEAEKALKVLTSAATRFQRAVKALGEQSGYNHLSFFDAPISKMPTQALNDEAQRRWIELNDAGVSLKRLLDGCPPDDPWMPIQTAPKDGTHILVCDARKPFQGYWTFNQRPPTVAHYFADLDNADFGFYTSVNETEPHEPLCNLTHWMPLPSAPAPLDVAQGE